MYIYIYDLILDAVLTLHFALYSSVFWACHLPCISSTRVHDDYMWKYMKSCETLLDLFVVTFGHQECVVSYLFF